MGKLVSIVYKPADAAAPTNGFTRLPLQEAQLLSGKGIDGDLKGIPTRQLNIMSAETVEQLGSEGFLSAPGQLGEQLLISSLPVDDLPVGARLQIGDSACIEVTEPRTGCAKFERYQDKQRTAASGRLGIMARVVTDGPIRIGDSVRLIASSSS